MDFRLLGQLEVTGDDGRRMAIGLGKRRALLTLLLVHVNEPVSSETIVDALWAGLPPATAAKSVQVYVWQLRRELGDGRPDAPPRLVTQGHAYRLHAEADDVDIRCFEREVTDGHRALAAGDFGDASNHLSAGLRLWRGPPLIDVADEAFAQGEISRLEELRLTALEGRADADLQLGRHHEIAGELQALVAHDPLREQLRAQAMLALYRCGRQADALALYRAGQRVLGHDLGLEPSAELRELEGRILAQSPQLDLTAERAGPRAPPGGGAGARRRRAPVVVAAAGGGAVLLAAALLAARAENGERPSARPGRLTVAPNSLVALSARTGTLQLALALPGTPVDVAAARTTAWVATVDSAAVTAVGLGAGTRTRTVPLPFTPSAVAVDGDRAWVADGRRGLIARVSGGDAPVSTRRYGPGTSAPISMAAGGGAVWIADGSRALTRIATRSRSVTSMRVPAPVASVAYGDGALWAVDTRAATLIRVDGRRGILTHRIWLLRGSDGTEPRPSSVAVAGGGVWVLSPNAGTVTHLDAAVRGVPAVLRLPKGATPQDIAGGPLVLVTRRDGALTSIDPATNRITTRRVGAALGLVAGTARQVWIATRPARAPSRPR